MSETMQSADVKKKRRGAVAPLFLIVTGGLLACLSLALVVRHYGDKSAMTTETRFYCNIKALNPAERAAHKELTDRLIAARRKITESENGYAFQFDASAISFPDLANWAVAEAKCCPFFDFHLDLENSGAALGLCLTGPEGVKPFLRAEFAVPAH
jgi:hypothetical protein